MNQMKSHKIQSVLTFIYIFLIPFTSVLYHCLLTTEAFQKYFPMDAVQPYLSFFFNFFMVLCLLSFISIIITTCIIEQIATSVFYVFLFIAHFLVSLANPVFIKPKLLSAERSWRKS